MLATVSARVVTNDGNAATPQSTIMNGAPLMTPPVVPVAYPQQPLIPVGPATFHPPYTPVCTSSFKYFLTDHFSGPHKAVCLAFVCIHVWSVVNDTRTT